MIERGEVTKIAFVGTSSVGKTTLLEIYRERHAHNSHVAFVEEAARIFFTTHPRIPVTERFQVAAQGQVQDLALAQEQAAHSSGARLIFCDRSVLDAVAYVRSTGDKKGSDRLLERIRNWIPTYTELFLLNPTGVAFTNDEVRQEDPETRQRFHDTFLDLFESEGINYQLLNGSLNERTSRVDEAIESSGVIYEA